MCSCIDASRRSCSLFARSAFTLATVGVGWSASSTSAGSKLRAASRSIGSPRNLLLDDGESIGGCPEVPSSSCTELALLVLSLGGNAGNSSSGSKVVSGLRCLSTRYNGRKSALPLNSVEPGRRSLSFFPGVVGALAALLTGVVVVELAREFGGRRKTRGTAVGEDAFLPLSETLDRVERCLGVFVGEVGAVIGSSESSWALLSSLYLGNSLSARPMSSFSLAGSVAAARAAPAAIPRPASPAFDI